MDIKKAARYAKRHTGELKVTGVLRYWLDYLDMAEQLEYDLKQETVAMPKDLKERHDTAATMVKIRASAEEKKKYQPRYKELRKRYEFRLGDLCVVVPESGEAIVAEGKTLEHCVGGYAARHMKGAVDILFLRHVRRPERSFLTIEMVPWKTGSGKPVLRQIHGYKNERYRNPVEPSVKFAWFLEPWMEWLKSGSKRDKNGQPVIPAGKEQTA